MNIPYEKLEQQIATVCIRAYAAHSYLYYERDESLITDQEFDALCVFLLGNYKWIKQWDLDKYLSRDALKAGTGFDIASKVCGQTKDYAESILAEHNKASPPENDLLGF